MSKLEPHGAPPTAKFLLQTVEAPPIAENQTATVVQQINPPDAGFPYKLRDWRSFTADGWGFALLLWEREEEDTR